MTLAVATRRARAAGPSRQPSFAKVELALLTLLAEKPLLNGEQLLALGLASGSQMARLLAHLQKRGLLSCSVPSGKPDVPANRYHHLSNEGVRLLARREGITSGRFAREHWLSPPRLTMLFNALEHTRGSHQFFVDLVAEAKKHGGEALSVWLGEAASAQRYLWHGEVRLLRPDGYGEYRQNGQVLSFFLEWDSGNMGPKRHRRKLKAYHECRASTGSEGFPAILAVTVDRRVRQLNRAALQVARGRRDLVLPLLITTQAELVAKGAFGCQWWDARSQQRVTLDAVPGPWINLRQERKEE